ncbi:1-acyl-sn-glycerol-3-phosphate acyltransferase delta [Halotydeus destructor]|nr:1-acyl-sn-glycerol-3-phosphate acyltransferase delta [Halotydeus destructor]
MTWMFIVIGVLGPVYIIGGLVLNLLQAVAWLTIRPLCRPLYIKINHMILYAITSQLVALAEWVGGSRVRLYFADEQSEKMAGKELAIFVINHRYEVDWLWFWMAMDKYHTLHKSKVIMKQPTRWLPVLGWAMYFSDYIFLARDWKRDRSNLGQGLDQLLQYSCPIHITLSCEGTRFTKKKHEASTEFAQSTGCPSYRHHLVPRGRGFVHCIQHLANKKAIKAVYNIQLAFHDSHNKGNPYTMASILTCRPLSGDVYVERIPIENIDVSSESAISDYLMAIFKKKDDLMDYHLEHARFPGQCRLPERRWLPFMNWVLCFSSVILILIWLIRRDILDMLTILEVIVTTALALFFLIRATRADLSSTNR